MVQEAKLTSADGEVARLEARVEAKLLMLERLLEQRIDAVARESQLEIRAARDAVTKAEVATERRFDSVKEFRAQLSDQTATFLPREVFDTTVQQWSEWRSGVDADRNRISGRDGGIGASFGWVVAATGFVATVLGIVVVLANVLTR